MGDERKRKKQKGESDVVRAGSDDGEVRGGEDWGGIGTKHQCRSEQRKGGPLAPTRRAAFVHMALRLNVER